MFAQQRSLFLKNFETKVILYETTDNISLKEKSA